MTKLRQDDTVQYRKVGTFRVIRQDGLVDERDGAGWYICRAIKAPKKYREEGDVRLWVSLANKV